MPIRPNAESRLISALVNVGDVESAARYSVSPEMFVSYATEYRWLLSYPEVFGGQPSPESLRTKFPEFPYSEAYTDVAFICSEVRQAHDKKQLVRLAKSFSQALYDDDVEEAYALLQTVSMPGQTMSWELRNALHDMSWMDVYEEEINGIPVPWPTLQKSTGGAAPGDLWYLAARPGQGKSWHLAKTVADALLAGKRATMFSLEMPAQQVMPRIHVLLGKSLGMDVRHSDLRGKAYDPILYRKLLGRIRDEVPGELFVVDTSKGAISTSHVKALSKGMDLTVIDYVGLMTSPLGGRAIDDWRVMASISNILKEIAISGKMPIIAAAQINREGDNGGYRPPKVKNLAQSDALGQDADVVITMKQRSNTVTISSLEKNRSGEGGALWHAMFRPNEGRFDEIGHDRAKEMMVRDEDKVADAK